MQAAAAHQVQSQNCLEVLNRMLALAMQTAEAASAENNHKLVLQAVREVTRLITLINKIAGTADQKPKAKTAPAAGVTQNAEREPVAPKWEKSGKEEGKIGVLERFFKLTKPDLHNSKKRRAPAGNSANHRPEPKKRPSRPIRWQDEPVILAGTEAEAV